MSQYSGKCTEKDLFTRIDALNKTQKKSAVSFKVNDTALRRVDAVSIRRENVEKVRRIFLNFVDALKWLF